VRIDSAAHEHAVIPPYYDSLVAKLIVHASDREHAIRRIQWAMDEFIVEGIDTTLPVQRELIAGEVFRRVEHYTRYVDEWLTKR
jgi:acetyl-CoA carboxylase biotin carboxylase subunit